MIGLCRLLTLRILMALTLLFAATGDIILLAFTAVYIYIQVAIANSFFERDRYSPHDTLL